MGFVGVVDVSLTSLICFLVVFFVGFVGVDGLVGFVGLLIVVAFLLRRFWTVLRLLVPLFVLRGFCRTCFCFTDVVDLLVCCTLLALLELWVWLCFCGLLGL